MAENTELISARVFTGQFVVRHQLASINESQNALIGSICEWEIVIELRSEETTRQLVLALQLAQFVDVSAG